MTTELPDGKLPDDTTQDQARPSLIQATEAGDIVRKKKHENLLATGSALTAPGEINLGANKRYRASKHGKYAFTVKTTRPRQEPVHSERDRNSGHRSKRP